MSFRRFQFLTRFGVIDYQKCFLQKNDSSVTNLHLLQIISKYRFHFQTSQEIPKIVIETLPSEGNFFSQCHKTSTNIPEENHFRNQIQGATIITRKTVKEEQLLEYSNGKWCSAQNRAWRATRVLLFPIFALFLFEPRRMTSTSNPGAIGAGVWKKTRICFFCDVNSLYLRDAWRRNQFVHVCRTSYVRG